MKNEVLSRNELSSLTFRLRKEPVERGTISNHPQRGQCVVGKRAKRRKIAMSQRLQLSLKGPAFSARTIR